MLSCEYCNYFKDADEKSGGSDGKSDSFCSFSGHAFEAGGIEAEYPCSDIAYQEYLNRRKTCVTQYVIKGDNWRILYKKQHRIKSIQ